MIMDAKFGMKGHGLILANQIKLMVKVKQKKSSFIYFYKQIEIHFSDSYKQRFLYGRSTI
jgi:hypothetical protein